MANRRQYDNCIWHNFLSVFEYKNMRLETESSQLNEAHRDIFVLFFRLNSNGLNSQAPIFSLPTVGDVEITTYTQPASSITTGTLRSTSDYQLQTSSHVISKVFLLSLH